jgi:putative acyl-CoA dehydrogenase
MRRALALAEDYSLKRIAFGKAIHQHPLFKETFLTQQSEFVGCLNLIFKIAEILLTGKRYLL